MRIGSILAVLAVLAGSGVPSMAGIGPVPVRVAMAAGTVCFQLDQPREVDFLQVSRCIDAGRTGAARWAGKNREPLWILAYDLHTPVKSRTYLTLKQIAYGQAFTAFTRVQGPLPLRPNVEYLVEINMGNRFARQTFTLLDDHTLISPGPGQPAGSD